MVLDGLGLKTLMPGFGSLWTSTIVGLQRYRSRKRNIPGQSSETRQMRVTKRHTRAVSLEKGS